MKTWALSTRSSRPTCRVAALYPVKKWNTETVIQFIRHSGLEEYEQSFRDNQIIGENLLKMDDNDMRELGVKAQGHIVKFRKCISKLLKINETQKRKRKINNKLLALRTHNIEKSPPNRISWDPEALAPAVQNQDPLGDSEESSSEASDASMKKTKKTTSGMSAAEKKKGDSIEVKRKLRKCSDDIAFKRSSSESSDELEDRPKEVEAGCSNNVITIYDRKRPKFKRTHSLVYGGDELNLPQNNLEEAEQGPAVLKSESK